MLTDKKILVVAPHPDDEALNSGGLIMKAKKEGGMVFVLYMATGSSRQFQNGETLEDDRIMEAANAAKYGNFDYTVGFNNISTRIDTLPQKD